MKDEKYIDHIKKFVAEKQGGYNKIGLVKELRTYGLIKDSRDPGLIPAKNIVERMIQEGILEMKTQEVGAFLQMNLPKRAFVGW